MNVAVDAMGGDHAPKVVVQGALDAVKEWGIGVTLVGDRDRLSESLGLSNVGTGVRIHHCTHAVAMDERPLQSLRRKRDSSIRVAFELCRRGEADAVVSAGNSGAAVAAALLTVGRISGIDRPALAGMFPGESGPVVLIDVGANVDCRPTHLLQFGIMGHAFATACLGVENPRLGLLSIGAEGTKGNEVVLAAHDLLRKSRLNFIGNIEGRDIFAGSADVVVCDGFVGNIVLKMSEGIADMLSALIKKELMDSMAEEIGLLPLEKAYERLKKRLDYAEYGGGAPILGINGVGIVCHGDSSAHAIKNAIKLAEKYARLDMKECLLSHLRKQESLPGA